MLRYVLLLLVVFLFYACCHKKGCVCIPLEVKLYVDSSVTDPNDNFILHVYEKGKYNVVVDTLPMTVSYPCYGCKNEYLLTLSNDIAGKRELYDFSYIIRNKTQTVSDTINEFKYDYTKNTFVCNACFAGNDMTKCEVYSNFSVTINGIVYQGKPDNFIIKK